MLRNGLLAGADFGFWFLFVLVFTLIASLFSIHIEVKNPVLGVQGLRIKVERSEVIKHQGWKSTGLGSGSQGQR